MTKTEPYTGTLRALTPKQVEVVWVEELEAKEGKNNLKRERAAIHKVTIEQLNSVVKDYDSQVLDGRHLDVLRFKAEWYDQGRLYPTLTNRVLIN